MIRLKTLILIGMVVLPGYARELAAEQQAGSCTRLDHMTFGILPFVSAEQLVVSFTPLAKYLTKYLGVPVRIETAPNFVEFARRTEEDQRYDILFTAPHLFPQAENRAAYRLIASVDSPGMWAVIVVPRDSSIKDVKDLVGKRLATVPPMSLATLLVRKFLLANGINPDTDLTLVETPTHDASLLSSYHKVTDASVLMQPPYESASPRVKDDTRVIARTDSSPHIPISVSPRVSDNCAAEITGLLLNMSSTEEGKEVLTHNNFSGFKPTSPEEYEKIRDMLVK